MTTLQPRTDEERQSEKLKASSVHANDALILSLKKKMEAPHTWEAGRACGFHAGWDACLRSILVRSLYECVIEGLSEEEFDDETDAILGAKILRSIREYEESR